MGFVQYRRIATVGGGGTMDTLAYIEQLEEPVRSALSPWAKRVPTAMLERASLKRLQRGEGLVRMLDRCSFVYVLCSGRVRTTSHALEGTTFTIDEFAAPAVFGEMELIAESPLYHGTVVALTACEFIAVRRDDYLRWLSSDPDALLKRARWVVQSLLKQSGAERNLLGWTGVKRIMFTLCQYAQQQADGDDIVIGASRAELAERANVSTKTVSRALAELERRGFLRRNGRKIVIDHAAYRRLDAAMRHELESSLHECREKEGR